MWKRTNFRDLEAIACKFLKSARSRSSRSQMFFRIGALKNCWGLFKLEAFDSNTGFFMWILRSFSEQLSLKNICERLLLPFSQSLHRGVFSALSHLSDEFFWRQCWRLNYFLRSSIVDVSEGPKYTTVNCKVLKIFLFLL